MQTVAQLKRAGRVVQAEQLTTIDRSDVLGVIEQLRPEDMARVDAALSFSLGLEA